MKTYSFTVILDEAEMTEAMANRLFDAGCDDGLCGVRHGVVLIGFDRSATALDEAIASAVRQIQSAGYKIQRVELDREELASLAAC